MRSFVLVDLLIMRCLNWNILVQCHFHCEHTNVVDVCQYSRGLMFMTEYFVLKRLYSVNLDEHWGMYASLNYIHILISLKLIGGEGNIKTPVNTLFGSPRSTSRINIKKK